VAVVADCRLADWKEAGAFDAEDVWIYRISQTDTMPSCEDTASFSEEWFHEHENPASLVAMNCSE
jgi:hypothetical protein